MKRTSYLRNVSIYIYRIKCMLLLSVYFLLVGMKVHALNNAVLGNLGGVVPLIGYLTCVTHKQTDEEILIY